MEIVVNFFTEFFFLFNEMAVYLLVGFFFAGLIHLFFPDSFVERHLGKRDVKSVLKSSIIGIPIPICSCGVIPLATSLRNKGASKGSTTSFLISTPQIGVDSFMVTYSLIGGVFAAFRIAAAFITSVFARLLVNVTDKEDVKPRRVINTEKMKSRWKDLPRYIQVELFGSIAKYLFYGLFVAIVITVFIPESFFEQYFSNQFLSMLLMLAVSIPLYVCAVSSTPIAASLILKGISPGAALIFLLAGPATNAITISTVNKLMGRKTTAIYVGSIAVVSILLGWLLNILTFSGTVSVMNHARFLSMPIIQYVGAVVLLLMFSIHVYRVIKSKLKSKEISMNSLNVQGMTCDHCVARVKKAAEDTGATQVGVNLSSGVLTYDTGDEEIIKQAIKDAGYEVG